ncbi:ABC transporter permease [Paludibaculum fermentans]|uniref:ABC transporter permease n=1 Tax=Paludibaculum fermentans TaxID=1473598 RepID=A0A7S7NXW6_PALFE|nr:ABC transporter permease [Paludibaculum fermentans]QOY91831.1 ABC transporter permease [Paludibaculum fermentans]
MNGSFQTLLTRAWNRLLFRWRRDRLEDELQEEISFHLAQIQSELHGAGLDQRSAWDQSRRQLGNLTLAKEECRGMWSFMGLERFVQDLRYAVRMYARTPVFTVISVVSLALGIGGNTAMFSLVNALLVRPLPYAQPEELVRITGTYPRAAVPMFRERSRAMQIAAVSIGSELNLAGQGPAIRVTGSSASPNFLSVLGASVARGRNFQAEEESPGRDNVVILSHSLWKSLFGGDPSTVGRMIRLNGVDREIVGIMPAGFSYPSTRVQLWIPMRLDSTNFVEYWGTEYMPLVARLRPGATISQAQGEVRRLVSELRGVFPFAMARDWNADSTAIPLQQDIIGNVRGKLIILLSAVGLVLLIACANVASLLLARATTRRKEMALRAALGASRGRIVRQLLTESVGLALTGAALGILVGAGGLSVFKALLPASLPGLAEAVIDWPIVAAISALALVTGLASGIAPALSAYEVNVTETIKTGSQRSTSGFWTRMRGVIIAGEVALTLVLLVSAGLMMRSLYKLSEVKPGFDPGRVLTVQISPNESLCAQRALCVALYDQLLQRSGEVAGVREAAIANSVPLDGQLPTIPVVVDGQPNTSDHPSDMLLLGAASAGYLELMRVPLLAGRYLMQSDGANSAGVAVLSAGAAQHFWPADHAIGKHIRPAGGKQWYTVVGVVGDVRHATLSKGLPDWVHGAIYLPYPQAVTEDGKLPAAMTLVAKVDTNDGRTRSELRQLAVALDPNVPVGQVHVLEEMVSGSISDFRSMMQVFLSFAGAAIVLAAVGIYGLMSYWVSQRTYEIGLRVAIGATRGQIVSMILAQGLRVSLYGVLGGILTAIALTRFLGTLLYGVAATDSLTFALVTALVLSVAVLAAAFPAWRAARIDPVKSLRAD